MNYDTMSVEELRNHYDILLLEEAILKKLGTVEALMSLEADKELVFVSLRKAVIREASVGSIAIKKGAECPLIDALVVTRGEHLEEWHRYDLIPKETP